MTSGGSTSDAPKKGKHVVTAVVAATIVLHHYRPQKRVARVPLCRKRRGVISIFVELGSLYTQRPYRMSGDELFGLHRLLLHQLQFPMKNGGSPNDLISSTINLAAALQFLLVALPMTLPLCMTYHILQCLKVFGW